MKASVYNIGPSPSGPVKVGVARDPQGRLATFQTAHWTKLHIFTTITLKSRARAFEIEAAVHRRLARYRLEGEWFNVTADEAARAIRDEAGIAPTTWWRRILWWLRSWRGR